MSRAMAAIATDRVPPHARPPSLQCGTTGESPTLSKDEKQKVISETIRLVKGRCQVVAGTGT
jgi:hypothetical protein